MDVTYSPEVQQSAEELSLFEQASALLAEILGTRSFPLVKAAWSRMQDHRGRALYRLTLKDSTGEVFTDFTSDDLRNPLLMQVSLARLWGDLLQIRNNLQHQQVQILIGQLATS